MTLDWEWEAATVKECKEQKWDPGYSTSSSYSFLQPLDGLSHITCTCTLHSRGVERHSVKDAKETLSIPLQAEVNYTETTLACKNNIKKPFLKKQDLFCIHYSTFYDCCDWEDCCSDGMERMMSESPGSVMLRTDTRKYLPQAVPSSMLLPV